MSVIKEFYVCQRNGETVCIPFDLLKKMTVDATDADGKAIKVNLDQKDLAEKYFEPIAGTGQWHSVTIRTPWVMRDHVDVQADIMNILPDGVIYKNPDLVPQKRVIRAVEEWTFRDLNGEPVPVTEEGFLSLPFSVADAVYTEVSVTCYPDHLSWKDGVPDEQ